MIVKEQVSLKSYNTFGIDVNAAFMAAFSTVEELLELIREPEFKTRSKLVLGGGSNILFTRNFEGLVIKNNLPGITITDEDNNVALVTAGAGVRWHSLVTWCIDKGLG